MGTNSNAPVQIIHPAQYALAQALRQQPNTPVGQQNAAMGGGANSMPAQLGTAAGNWLANGGQMNGNTQMVMPGVSPFSQPGATDYAALMNTPGGLGYGS